MCNSVSSLRLGYLRFTNRHSLISMPRNALKLPPAMASDSFVWRDARGSSVAVSVSRGRRAIIVACAEHRGRSTSSDGDESRRWREGVSTRRDAEIVLQEKNPILEVVHLVVERL